MGIRLADNIRTFRKQRRLTQEQLAEGMGVTAGAVHKWETGLATPELSLILKLADFFEVSTDVLLGYEMRDNRPQSISERLTRYINTEDPEGLKEAENALRRFPHSFDIVYLSAVLFMIFGGKTHQDALLLRASELLRKSLLLLPQNTNPGISDIGIYAYMANVQIMRGQGARAAALLREHNREGIYDDQIGMTLSLMCRQPEDAQPFLSRALLGSLTRLFQTVIGKAYAFVLSGDPDSAENLLLWGLNLFEGIKQSETAGYPDQACSYLYTLLSCVYLKRNCPDDARKAMSQALELAERFDSLPSYDATSVRYIPGAENYFLHFILGSTARESIAYLVALIADPELTDLWEGAGGGGCIRP